VHFPLNKINAALKQLQATARSFKSVSASINFSDKGIAKASAEVRRPAHASKRVADSQEGTPTLV
jgi:hypothetical protein